MAGHVLLAFDDSIPATRALEHAVTEMNPDRLSIVSVVEPGEVLYWSAEGGYVDSSAYDHAREQCEERVEKARSQVEALTDGAIPVETVVRTGRPDREVVAYAEEAAVDHVVVGSHGRSGPSRILLGSIAESIIRRSPTPVTVVR